MVGEGRPSSPPKSRVPACCNASDWAAPAASSGGTPSTSHDSLVVSFIDGLETSDTCGLLAGPVMARPTSTGRKGRRASRSSDGLSIGPLKRTSPLVNLRSCP